MPLFFTAAFLLGAIAAPVVNRWSDRFLFTWPISLFAAQQGTIAALAWAGRRGASGRGPWVSLLAVIGFLATCLAYFDLTRRAGLSPTWGFLLGFLPSWPLAVPAARGLLRGGSPWIDLALALLSFSLFYWASAAVTLCHLTSLLR